MSKKVISVFLALAMVVGCFSIAATAKGDVDTKVSFTATSNDTDFLTGEVFSDYSAKITVPMGSVVNAGEVTGSLAMTNIASLGIEGTRTYEKSITTGVEKKVLLDNYLPAFTNATVSGLIDGNPYFYDVTGVTTEESYTIEAVPADVEETRTAFRALTSHVTSETKEEDDSYALIPGTAYVQIGTEKLSIENPDETLKLDNIVQGSGIKAEIRSAVKLEEVEELEDAQVEIFLPAGTVLAVGQSAVTLDDNTSIKMYGYRDNDKINTILSTLRDCQTNEEIIVSAVLFITDFANAIEEKDLVVNVDFEEVGIDVSGTVETFDTAENAETTIELVLDDEVIRTVSVADAGVQNFMFEHVLAGTYILRVSKLNHVTREYEITVGDEAVVEELKIHLLGDINGDGKVNTLDVAFANAHAKKVYVLNEYEMLCADINDDGKVNTIDVSLINAHAKKVNLIW